MAKRHVVLYYLQIENQYKEELENLKELQELVLDGKVEEWQVEQCKESVEKLKNTYETIASIIFELNRPNTNSKEDKYLLTYFWLFKKFFPIETLLKLLNTFIK